VDSDRLRKVGRLEREEAGFLVTGYTFNLQENTLVPTLVPNPDAGRKHCFVAYREINDPGPQVAMEKTSDAGLSDDEDS
jgi:hypothetical protein